MDTLSTEFVDAAKAAEALRRQLERCQAQLDEAHIRIGQMESLFANVADAIFVCEPDGRIIDVNPAACEMLGYPRQALLEMRPWDFVTSASRDEILGLVDKMQPDVPSTVQRAYKSRNGQQRAMDLRMTRFDSAGRDLIIVSCRDVTEQKRLEDRLRQSERNLAEGQRLTKTGSWILDFATGNTDWSVETCRIFGFPDPPPSPHYSEFRERVRPEDRERVDQALRESFEAGEPRPLEYLFLLPNGVSKYIETISQPVRDETGAVVKLMGTVMDVTDRKKAEAALQHAFEQMQAVKDELRLAIDTIPGLVWTALPDGYIDFLNQRWREYTGLTLEEAIGWGWQSAVCSEDLPRLLEYWKSIVASGKPGETEARLRQFDGTYRWFLFRGVPLYDQSGNLIKWYGTNTDIEARKWAEALLAGENRVLEMIARNDPLPSLLDALCRLIEEMCKGALCSILLLDSNSRRLWHGAAPSLPRSYTKGIDGSTIDSCAGPCGVAAWRKELVIVADIDTDPMWAHYRVRTAEHGLRACWSAPILSSQKIVLGTFAIYSREPRSPTAEERSMIEQFAHVASIAIERKRAEEALRRSEAYLAEAQRLSLTGSFCWRPATREITWSEETFRIYEYSPDLKPTLELARQRIHPDDLAVFQEKTSRAPQEGKDFELEHRLLMPGGVVKHVNVVARAVRDESGEVEFVGAVMDITERKRAAEALRASEHLARGQLDALAHTLDSFAQESDPDKLLEHVLRTIVEQSDAHSVSVWTRNDAGGWLDLIAVIEDGQFQTRKDAVHPAATLPMLAQDHPVWSEILRTGKHAVLEGIDEESARVCVGSEVDATWHRILQDTDRDAAMALLKKHLRGLGVRAILFVPMLIAGTVAGIIGIRFKEKRTFRKEEIELTRALAHQAMLAIQLMRLSQQSREVAVAAERNRMARDIHDTLAQGFTGVIMQLEAAEEAMSQNLALKATGFLDRAGDLARESLREARRSVRALRPEALEHKNLCQALEGLIRKMTAGTTVRAEFGLQGEPGELPPEWEENLLRIGQEVLTNALRHAQASEFKVQLVFDKREIRLNLRDNGRGFDPRTRHDGFGLQGIRERVEGMGGQLSIQSVIGEGTVISIVLPLTHPFEPAKA